MAVLSLSLIPPNALPFSSPSLSTLGAFSSVSVCMLEEEGVRGGRAFAASAGMKMLEGMK